MGPPPPPQKEVVASVSASAESESSYHYNIQEKGKYDNSSVSLTATTSTMLGAVHNVSFLFEKRPPIERDSSSPETKRSRRNIRTTNLDGHGVQDVSAGCMKLVPATQIIDTTTQSHAFMNNCNDSKKRNSSSNYVVAV